MGRIVVKTNVRASAARCFDLARDVGVHCRTSAFTAEKVLPPGRTSGRLELGDTVTFVGRHFGFRWRLTASIVEMEHSHRFVDEATGRAFRWLRHVHEFTERDGITEMIDTLEWQSPAAVLGKIADWLLIERHMEWYVTTKQQALKILAESAETLDNS
jgi:ligand-binding SRPBCC domain-containing protein